MLSLLRQSPLIREIAKQILREHKPPPLGRWTMEECPTKMKQKIDLANEDHCGPCGQYAMEQLEKKVESRLQEVEKKTDGLTEFLTKH
jgi:hypothetical protein